MRTWLEGLPAFLRWLVYLLILFIVIIVLAWVAHALGGFDLHFRIGHFVFRLAVT
jgi:hypothetical protein